MVLRVVAPGANTAFVRQTRVGIARSSLVGGKGLPRGPGRFLEGRSSLSQNVVRHTPAMPSDAPDHPLADAERLLSTREAASLLGVRPVSVRRWLTAGKLPGHKVGIRWRIPLAVVVDLPHGGQMRGDVPPARSLQSKRTARPRFGARRHASSDSLPHVEHRGPPRAASPPRQRRLNLPHAQIAFTTAHVGLEAAIRRASTQGSCQRVTPLFVLAFAGHSVATLPGGVR